MSEPMYRKDENDEWVKVVVSSNGEEHEISLSDEERERIEAHYGDSSKASVTKGEIKDLLRSAMELGIQKERERNSTNSREGGGVISLNGKQVNPTSGNPYQTVHNELDRLHREEARGGNIGRKAKMELDGLFEILGRQILEMTGAGIVMVQCPKCSKPITTSETSVCGFCSFDLEGESGFARYGEIYGGKRRS